MCSSLLATKAKPKLLVALPTYDGRRHNGNAMVDLALIRNLDVRLLQVHNSLLAMNFNKSWCEALNWGADAFMMLHADIVPVTDFWPAILFQELYDRKASVLSVVSPIKTPAGLTSTALETEDAWNPQRLSMAEVFEKPETFTDERLLINTGLMLVDMRQPWVHEFPGFTINDRILIKDGLRYPQVQPEDWNFSREAKRLGASLYATRKIVIQHVGEAGYDNSCAWGTQETDPMHVSHTFAPETV